MLNILVHFLHIPEIDKKNQLKGLDTAKRKRERTKNEIARKNFELQNFDIGTLKNQKNFDVNISFEKEKK